MMTFFSPLNSLDFQYFFKRGQTSAMSGDLLCWPEISFPAYSPSISHRSDVARISLSQTHSL